jgi:hypothetical protein
MLAIGRSICSKWTLGKLISEFAKPEARKKYFKIVI